MGYDLHGHEPTNETGRYFRNSVWGWHPLAEFVLCVCDIPEEEALYWHTNNGHCVSKDTALHIAERLQELVESGEVKRYAEDREKWLESLPYQQCDLCKGTGQRDDKYAKGQCNVCKGLGMIKDSRTFYLFGEKNVVNFIAFCKYSGGFDIS